MKATDFLNLERTLADRLFLSVDYPWDALDMLEEYIYRIGRGLDGGLYEQTKRGVWVARSASVSESAELTAPVIVGERAGVGRLSRVGAAVIIGNEATVGNGCEIRFSVMLDGAALAQNNYLSDTIVGYMARLSAGAIVSSQRADRRDIVCSLGAESVICDRKRFGAVVGDLATVGASSVLSAGSVLEKGAEIEPLTRARGYISASAAYLGERISADIL